MIIKLFIVSLLVEAVIEAVTLIGDKKSRDWKQLIAFIFGSFLAWAFGISLLKYIGIGFVDVVPFWLRSVVDIFLVGVLLFRYSGSWNDLLSFLGSLRPI